MHDGAAEGLRTAFTVLLRDAPAERAEHALKIAIKVLLDSPRLRLGNRSPVVSSADQQRWAAVKPKLRAHLSHEKIGMACVARKTALPLSTVQRALSPNGPVPGRAVIQLLDRWLSTESSKSPPAISATAETEKIPARISHDRIGPLPTRHLSEDEAGRLLTYLELTPVRQVRDELQMSLELAQQAAIGGEIPPEAVERIHALLAAPD